MLMIKLYIRIIINHLTVYYLLDVKVRISSVTVITLQHLFATISCFIFCDTVTVMSHVFLVAFKPFFEYKAQHATNYTIKVLVLFTVKVVSISIVLIFLTLLKRHLAHCS